MGFNYPITLPVVRGTNADLGGQEVWRCNNIPLPYVRSGIAALQSQVDGTPEDPTVPQSLRQSLVRRRHRTRIIFHLGTMSAQA